MDCKSKGMLRIGLVIVLFLLICSSGLFAQMRDITAYQIVADMKVGWNLGNNFDSLGGDETAWGNPTPTQGLIDAIRAMGFKTVRIPVSWGEHVGAGPSYTIDAAWLAKVENVVNWTLDAGMYAIVNMHHDNSWLIPTYANETAITAKFTAIWTQIANRFKNYSDYLLFELMNEPRVEYSTEEWTGGTAENRAVINHLNQAGLNVVRATGGNNAQRFVVLATHAAASLEIVMRDFVVPGDARIIISQHTYFPQTFCFETGGASAWGTADEKAAVDAECDRIRNFWDFYDLPVIVGEWGSVNKSNTAARVAHAEYYSHAVRIRGMLPVWWDNGYPDVNQFGLINRSSYAWDFPEIARAVVNGAGGSNPNATPLPTIPPFEGWDCATIPQWEAETAYYPSDMIVQYNGYVYSNRWWTMGDNPVENSLPDYGTWKWLGPCSGSGPVRTATPVLTATRTPTQTIARTATRTPTTTAGGTLGDVNGSGTIDIVDALMTAQHYVGLAPSPFNTAVADVNRDGQITIIDALMIAQYYVGLITGF